MIGVDIVLVALATLGLAISSYFTAVAYQLIRPDVRWIPSFCRMEERTCASIVSTPQARVFGPPNSLLGQGYYVSLLAALTWGLLDQPVLLGLYTAASVLTVGLAGYLSYQLLYVVRVPCPLCFASHGINSLICVLLLARLLA